MGLVFLNEVLEGPNITLNVISTQLQTATDLNLDGTGVYKRDQRKENECHLYQKAVLLVGPRVAANPQDKHALIVGSRILVITNDWSVFAHDRRRPPSPNDTLALGSLHEPLLAEQTLTIRGFDLSSC